MKTKNFFTNFIFNLDFTSGLTLTQINKIWLKKSINQFNQDILLKLEDKQLIGIIFKLRITDDSVISITPLIRSSNSQHAIKNLIELIKTNLDIKTKTYSLIKATHIIISYHIFDLKYNQLIEDKDPFEINLADKLSKDDLEKYNKEFKKISVKEIESIKYMEYSGYKLPLNYDNMQQDFLKINPKFINEMNYHNLFKSEHIKDSKWIFRIVQKITNKTRIVWTDEKLDNGLMKRTIGKHLELIINLKMNIITLESILNLLPRESDFIKPIKKDKNISFKFITLDLECYGIKINNEIQIKPFLLGLYNPELKLNKTIQLINNQMHTIISDYLLTYKYSGYIVYAHNLSSFDGIFILQQLVKLSEVTKLRIEPLFRDRKLIQIKVFYSFNPKDNSFRYSIIFRDSLLIFLTSLDKLSKTFLNYLPELQKDTLNGKILINQILNKSQSEIDSKLNDEKFINDFKKYCLQDCISLWHIIAKFNDLIFNKYSLNIHNYPTLPSLAFAIFRSHFMKTSKIHKITGIINNSLRKSYTGGHVDVYKLYSNKECRLYDFTSLYPAAMVKNKMPIKLIDKFKGDPFKNDLNMKYLHNDNIVSFINCDIFVDNSINRPVFQTHINFKNEIRTMCATGTFLNQWIFLPEILEYQRLTNNKIRIIPNSIREGYRFESEFIFNNYILDLFAIKKSVNKSNPWYLISKILMNSLYGRFGLKPTLQDFILLDKEEIETFLSSVGTQINCTDILDIDDTNKSFIILNKNIDDLNISVAIASAITAYSRMMVAPLLLDNNIIILYTDTDCYVIEGDLSKLQNGKYAHLLHNELGGLKLETIFSEFIAIAPKLYGGITTDNTEIVKIKGFKDKLELDKLRQILFDKNIFILKQNKWFKSIKKGSIEIKENPYTLEINENKRQIDMTTLLTKPYHFDSYSNK